MTTETAIPAVYAAIVAVQGAMAAVGIAKTQKNTQQNYLFRGIDDVYGALAPILKEHGLCILPRVIDRNVTERTAKSGGVLFHVSLHIEYDLVSATDGSRHVVCVYGEAMDSGDKATNKAMSAAYKTMCFQAFCIPLEGEPDADKTTPEEIKPAPEPETEPLITDEQRIRIFALAKELKIDSESLHARAAKVTGRSANEISFSAKKDNALTAEEAEIIENKMKAMKKKLSTKPADPGPDDSPGLALAACMSVITGLHERTDEGAQYDALAECGIKSLAEIKTSADADAYIAALQKRMENAD